VPPERLHGPLVAAAAALVLLVNLGGTALHDEDEPRNAACSLAMLDRGDWVVPTFNGRLRPEKPALVNWLQIAGFSLVGRNETGARLAGALTTVVTCLLTWRIGRRLQGPAAGLLAGLAMATCVWTAVAGRAATPDAPLGFATTLALHAFVGGVAADGTVRLSRRRAVLTGVACGVAVLAKGPVGLVLPLTAFVASGIALAVSSGGRRRAVDGLRAVRSGWIIAASLTVSVPWYAWVGLRTDGEWLRGFFLVHNVGRFTGAMEGHAGSPLYYPIALAVGFFPWSIVLVAALARGCVLASRPGDARHAAAVITTIWMGTWVAAFSASATKLPGYVWPAYPALALLTASFLGEWAADALPFGGRRRGGSPTPDRILGVAWSILVAVGIGGMAVVCADTGLPPSARWLALSGVIAAGGGALAWYWQRRDFRLRALATLSAAAVAFTAPLATFGPIALGAGSAGARRLATALPATSSADAWVAFGPLPASVVFYTNTTIRSVGSAAEALRHLRTRPDGLLFVMERHAPPFDAAIAAGFRVVHRVALPFADDLLVIGRDPTQEHLLACQVPSNES